MTDLLTLGFVGESLIALFGLLTALVSLLGFAFWVWMLIDCATRERSEGNDKIIWVLIILLTNLLGALIYFFARRPQRIATHGR